MASLDAMVGLLDLVASSGGELDSRIRLQKEAYLLGLLGDRHFRPDAFEYHHYGPYSREISDALQDAVLGGLLLERKEVPDDNSYVKYSYKITDSGFDYIRDAGAENSINSQYVNFLSSCHWRALELAATVKFLEIDEGLADRAQAFEEAIDLKPQTKKYKDDARKILEDLGL